MRPRCLIALVPAVATALFSCTTTTTSAVGCGPDNVATTNLDVVATTQYEAAYYWAAADPIPADLYTSGGVTVAAAVQAISAPVSTLQAATAASAVAAAVGNYYPNGCATAAARACPFTVVSSA